MGIRTGKQLLESLRDDRQLFIDGERVSDVTTDPRFAAAAQSLAELYDMQHDPALVERMTFSSPTTGGRVGLSFIEPRSVDDLIVQSGLQAHEVLATTLVLEVKRLCRQLPGKRFLKA